MVRILEFLVLGTASLVCGAQTVSVQPFEVEARVGLAVPMGGYHGGKTEVGGALGVELRYNFDNTPFDAGMLLDLSCAMRSYERNGHNPEQNNRTLAWAIVGDYNLRQGIKVNPFAGLGIGAGFNDVVGVAAYPTSGVAPVFIPRIGIELIRHIRVTVSANITRRGYNNLSITIGGVIGGRPKKRVLPDIGK